MVVSRMEKRIPAIGAARGSSTDIGLRSHIVISNIVLCSWRTKKLKPPPDCRPCAELARQGHETGNSRHHIAVRERRLLTQGKWDEVYSFEHLISPEFEQ